MGAVEQAESACRAAIGCHLICHEHGADRECVPGLRTITGNSQGHRNGRHQGIKLPEGGRRGFIINGIRPFLKVRVQRLLQTFSRIQGQDMCRHQAVHARHLLIAARREQAQATQTPHNVWPGIFLAGLDSGQFRVPRSGEGTQPGPGHAIWRKQSGKLQGGKAGRILQAFQRLFKNECELLFPMTDLTRSIRISAGHGIGFCKPG